MKKEEAFTAFIATLNMKGIEQAVNDLTGRTSSEIYDMYRHFSDANLSQRALSTRLSKEYGEWLHLEMKYNEQTMKSERTWTSNDR